MIHTYIILLEWKHLVAQDKNKGSGLAMIPKLKYEHIYVIFCQNVCRPSSPGTFVLFIEQHTSKIDIGPQ